MKTLLLSLIIVSSFAHAEGPISCYSNEKLNGQAVVKVKINHQVERDGFRHNVLGVTMFNGYRFVTYGSGVITESSLGFTVVERQTVKGKVTAQFNASKGYYEGSANISEVNNGKSYAIKCADDQHIDLVLQDCAEDAQ